MKVPDTADVIPLSGLEYIPQTPGEKMITLKVAQHEGEPETIDKFRWLHGLEQRLEREVPPGSNCPGIKYLMRSLPRPTSGRQAGHQDGRPGCRERDRRAEFAGRFNVYILSDLPADYLTPQQHRLLAEAVRQGAGFMMLGGHSASVPAAGPYSLEGHLFPPRSIRRRRSSPRASSSFPTRGDWTASSSRSAPALDRARIWDMMPPITGTNRFGEVKNFAIILAETPGPNPNR